MISHTQQSRLEIPQIGIRGGISADPFGGSVTGGFHPTARTKYVKFAGHIFYCFVTVCFIASTMPTHFPRKTAGFLSGCV
jgi:hypothetical protein